MTTQRATSIRILLADDHVVVRTGLAMLIRGTSGMQIVGEASNGREAITMTAELKPDVIVMDLNMPEVGGVDATQKIIAANPSAKILALSSFNDRGHVLGVLRAGAIGYIIKDCAADELIAAIRTIAAGGRHVSASLSHSVIYDSLTSTSRGDRDRLTAREREVLQLLAEGKAMKQVGQMLHISTKTVETHRRAVMEKLQLFSTAELTKHAVREGLTTLD